MSEAIGLDLRAARELALSDLSEFDEQPTVKLEDLAFVPDQILGPELPD